MDCGEWKMRVRSQQLDWCYVKSIHQVDDDICYTQMLGLIGKPNKQNKIIIKLVPSKLNKQTMRYLDISSNSLPLSITLFCCTYRTCSCVGVCLLAFASFACPSFAHVVQILISININDKSNSRCERKNLDIQTNYCVPNADDVAVILHFFPFNALYPTPPKKIVRQSFGKKSVILVQAFEA